ncbi:MAG: hypothetical protein HKO95_15700 [Rhodobacteraceae bacterium]|nr:hypothetical protein [Alphaproteobacteria bacterium]NNF72827.1 hypothetical protein [Paracoccaceae bacterium]NNK68170.1 hypothetical protein [Paracoccaceae bacterium]
MTRFQTVFACAAAIAALSGPAVAELPDSIVQAQVLSGWRMESGEHMAAIRLELAPGWKTYWRSPGDAGIPPEFDWSGSDNLASYQPHWPVPKVSYLNGVRSVGYADVVVVPIRFTPQRAGEAIDLTGQMHIGVCESVCVPMTLNIAASLPASTGQGGNDTIRRALADRPLTQTEAGVSNVVCRIEPISDGLRVAIDVEMPAMGNGEEAVVEFADRSVWVAEPQAERTGGTLTVITEMVPQEAAPFAMARSDVRVTVFGNGAAVDIQGCPGS